MDADGLADLFVGAPFYHKVKIIKIMRKKMKKKNTKIIKENNKNGLADLFVGAPFYHKVMMTMMMIIIFLLNLLSSS